ncbi:MAG: hypothetical protein E4H05_06375 [Acidimicrobiales bacterium]|nr:MAG: hypothetical protein E4H05_06375 [Acidimicrobiales bacterium]
MVDLLDSNAFRVAVYVLVALLSLWWGVRERRWVTTHAVDWWPFYWFMSAALLGAMGIARASAFGDVLGEIGREQARSGGWYDTRRTMQAVLVIGVAVVWLLGVAVAVLRVPPRRRRYLPHVILLSTILAFAAIRLVSLHQVDTVLYRRDVAGVRIVALVELGLLAANVVVMLTTARFPRDSPERPVDAQQRTPRADVV